MEFEKTRYPAVWKKKLKNGDISYYITYREAGAKTPKRKRVGTKKTGMTAKKAREILVNNQTYFIPKSKDIAKTKNEYPEFYQIIRGDKTVSLYLLAYEYFIANIDDRFIDTLSLFRQTQKYQTGPLNPYGRNYESVLGIEYLNRLLQALASFSPNPIEANKIRNYRKQIQKFITNHMPVQEFKHSELDSLDITIFKGVEKYWKSLGKSPKTIADNFHMIKAIINWAYANEAYKGKNPIANLTISAKKRKRERYLSKKEVQQLIKRVKKENINVYLSVYLALLTAGRASTVLNIQKRDIDFKRNQINLKNIKKDRIYQIPFTKKEKYFLKNIVKNLDDEDYLIHSIRPYANKKIPMSKIPPRYYQIVDELFNQETKKTLDPLNIVNFHTLRHTVATLMIQDKVDIYRVSKMLDHTSIEETQRYAKLGAYDLQEAIQTTSNLLN